LTAFLDARTLPSATVLEPDIAIIGGGPAGISLALALADTKLNILLLESGGENFDPANQKMYGGTRSGLSYIALDAGRLRFLGGRNHVEPGKEEVRARIQISVRRRRMQRNRIRRLVAGGCAHGCKR